MVTIRYGAGIRTVTIDGQTLDLNAMSAADFLAFQRDFRRAARNWINKGIR